MCFFLGYTDEEMHEHMYGRADWNFWDWNNTTWEDEIHRNSSGISWDTKLPEEDNRNAWSSWDDDGW